MARTYDLNPDAAKEANNGGKRITDPGKYTGKITAAWSETNAKGTESVALLFASDHGQEAGPLVLYTHNGDGKELPSYKTLNAIMACCKQRRLTIKQGPVELYDRDAGKPVTKHLPTYPELTGQRIGLVLTAEEYTNRDGDTRTKLVIAAPFEADTGRMAAEVLDRAETPAALDHYVAYLDKNHRWLKPLAGNKPAPSSRQASSADPFPDDDIPF